MGFPKVGHGLATWGSFIFPSLEHLLESMNCLEKVPTLRPTTDGCLSLSEDGAWGSALKSQVPLMILLHTKPCLNCYQSFLLRLIMEFEWHGRKLGKESGPRVEWELGSWGRNHWRPVLLTVGLRLSSLLHWERSHSMSESRADSQALVPRMNQ